MKRIAISILAIFCSFGFTFAQGVSLDDFSVIQHQQEVFLKWIIARGYTCNGIRIERSADNIYFEEIGYIPGICGSANFAQPFSFVDDHPQFNQTNYYRLELGLQGYSATRQITLHDFSSETLQISPNPVQSTVLFRFNNSQSRPHTLEIISINGAVMHQYQTTDSHLELELSHLPAGMYFARLTRHDAVEVVATSRLVIARP